MSRTLVISDELYAQLEAAARERRLDGVERLLEVWRAHDEVLKQRRDAVNKLDALRTQIFATYGEMSDSTELIREDRSR